MGLLFDMVKAYRQRLPHDVARLLPLEHLEKIHLTQEAIAEILDRMEQVTNPSAPADDTAGDPALFSNQTLPDHTAASGDDPVCPEKA
ncbi:hypothetical protein [Brevibacillus dissolubilis]|uniref:hypothetical protein n=1 Tax=Brevibacillus dissolubilis TaxID=1844116 RepID=UPI001116A958|nr:hypothetical protein [Brevibacillus dissolubilis]